jgi:paraquat-inducible protein A
MTNNEHPLIACHQCDLLLREVPLPQRGEAECPRCGAELYRDKPLGLDLALAFTIAAAVMFLFANAFPLMELDTRGLRATATLLDTVTEMRNAGYGQVALLILATAIVAPALVLGGLLYVLVPLRLGRIPHALPQVFRMVSMLRRWAMIEVFMLAAFVSLARLTHVATVYVGVALYAMGLFIMLFTAAEASFEPRVMWRRVGELEGR